MTFSKFLDPKNDVAFRRIFGTERNKDILIHFINDVLELKGADQIQEVTFLSTIQEPEIAAKKQSVVDVLCKDANGVQVIIEMQVAPQNGFEKRAQYYAAKAYSRQLNKGSEEGSRYQDLKAVIFIAITDYIVFQDKIFYKSDHVILDKESYAHDLKDFSFTFIELPKFKITNVELLTNIIEKWCFFFKNAEKTSEADLRKLIGRDGVIERAYEELNQFNWTEQELLTYEKEIKRVMDNQAAEDYLINAGKAAGLEIGRQEGVEIGKEIGREEEKIAIARAMLIDGDAPQKIARITGLAIQDIEKLKS